MTGLRTYPTIKDRPKRPQTAGGFGRRTQTSNLMKSVERQNMAKTLNRQRTHTNFLAQPKRRVVPFYKWCTKSDRRDILKRKHRMFNTHYNIY